MQSFIPPPDDDEGPEKPSLFFALSLLGWAALLAFLYLAMSGGLSGHARKSEAFLLLAGFCVYFSAREIVRFIRRK